MTSNLLISSCGSKVPLLKAAQDAFARLGLPGGVIAGDISESSLSFYFAKSHWIMPEICDQNLEVILVGCLERNVRLILPTRDEELLWFAKNLDSFKQLGVSIISSSSTTVETCLDKFEFYKTLSKNNIPAIRTCVSYEADLGDFVTVKERFGAGARGVRLGLTQLEAVHYSRELRNPVFQPTIEGEEFSIDIWSSIDGIHVLSSPRLRKKIVDGESRVTKVFKSIELNEISKKIVKVLNLRGLAVVQGFFDRHGTVVINECNSRFGGASTATINAGGYILDLVILDFLGYSTKKLFESIKINEITQVRVPLDTCF
jgi:carbamoyl-phosphate synthase large subunit